MSISAGGLICVVIRPKAVVNATCTVRSLLVAISKKTSALRIPNEVIPEKKVHMKKCINFAQ